MKRPVRLGLALLIIVVAAALAGALTRRAPPGVRAQLIAPAGEATGYARADGPRPFNFPADHGPHDDFQTEWWYYTGNLETSDGRHFGYQLTFFRRALVPPTQQPARTSNWAADQAYMAHFALTDVAGRRHYAFQRFDRGAAGLAGAQSPPFQVWLEDWNVQAIEPNVYRLRARQQDLALDLQLVDGQGPILQGDHGYSQKGPERGNASYYYSLTRLASSGAVQIDNAAYQVNGLSWMDHEYSTSALASDQVGWDWFALQMDDGSELMVFQIRKADGSVDPFSSGTLVATDGSTRRLLRDDFSIGAGATWRSPHSGATYPAEWQVQVPSVGLALDIKPYLADQESTWLLRTGKAQCRFVGSVRVAP